MAALAHVTDLHLDGGPRAAEPARRALALHVRDDDGRPTTHVRSVPVEA